MFQSIVINLEEQNKEMMSRLKQDGASGGGEGMQMQGSNSIENIKAFALALKISIGLDIFTGRRNPLVPCVRAGYRAYQGIQSAAI